jgi:hypothetical protein
MVTLGGAPLARVPAGEDNGVRHEFAMLVFRIICAGLLAWAVVWVLLQPQAARLLRAVPEMGAIAPIAGAYVGAFSLAARQGWGLIVALANGIWAGILAILASGVLYTAVQVTSGLVAGDLARLFDRFGDAVDRLLAAVGDAPLLALSLAATATVGVLTELVHWVMVRVRSKWQRSN